MSDNDKPKLQGRKKGGTKFPQVSLEDATKYAKKLVSKTHTGPQSETVILPGVFGSSTSPGKIRASALKQYGLMIGEAAAYEASKLAKDLDSAPDDERAVYLRQAFMNVNVFKSLYDTFVGDSTSPAKIRQQVAQLGVHPDNAEKATKLFIDSAVFCGAAAFDGDNVALLRLNASGSSTDLEPQTNLDETQLPSEDAEDEEVDTGVDKSDMSNGPRREGGARAVINVSVTLDSSLDTDKLEKQLRLLRKYGAL